jgi:putative flippase GtrA
LRFQIANGALSIGGNLVLMQVLVSTWAMNYTLANVVSITLCSILNFLASDRLVFARPRHLAPHDSRRTLAPHHVSKRPATV